MQNIVKFSIVFRLLSSTCAYKYLEKLLQKLHDSKTNKEGDGKMSTGVSYQELTTKIHLQNQKIISFNIIKAWVMNKKLFVGLICIFFGSRRKK